MALVKNNAIVEDRFVDASAADAIPATGAVLVSLPQWQAQRDALLTRKRVHPRAEAEHRLDVPRLERVRTAGDERQIEAAVVVKSRAPQHRAMIHHAMIYIVDDFAVAKSAGLLRNT